MDVGIGLEFNNPHIGYPDADMWQDEIRLGDLAEPLGFDSLWVSEHHFTDYCVMPDALQFLTYMAGRTSRIKLGSQVVVLPWHDPVRVTEQIIALDILSQGRTILGIGRGIAQVEFEGLRIRMGESRERFVECAEIVLAALETGIVEYDGKHFQQPRREIRPRPRGSFQGRVYSAGISPESMQILGKLGAGMAMTAQKPWEVAGADLEVYRAAFLEAQGKPAPAPTAHVFTFCDTDGDRAHELGRHYVRELYRTSISHYRLDGSHFDGLNGYEYYSRMSKNLNRHGDEALDFFADLQVVGTPEECIEKIRWIQSVLGADTYVALLLFGGMSGEEGERNMRCFAENVLPALKSERAVSLQV